jgi:hypothetical protein
LIRNTQKRSSITNLIGGQRTSIRKSRKESEMTLPNMESSEMSQETESGEVQEIVESLEVQEAAQALEQATFEPEAVVELEGNHEEAEVVEAAFVEVMKGAETSAGEGGRPGGGVEATPINLPNPVEEAAVLPVPIPGPQGETGDSTAIIDSNDGLGDVALSPDDVKIDTVPLPEKPETLASHTEKAADDVAIGTWPTPERTVDGVSIIDSNDGPRVQQRIKPELDNDSDSPPPPPLDSNNMEIPEGLGDGPPGRSASGLEMQKTVEVPDERSDVLQSAGAADEGSGGERTLKYDGREEDKFDPGVEQKFDPHQENRIKDGYGSVAGTGGKDVSGEYQGGEMSLDDPRLADEGDPFENFVDENGLPINPESGAGDGFDPIATIEDVNKMDSPLGDVTGVMGEGNRPDPADLAADMGLDSGPQFGIDGTDLRGAASPGADQRAAGVLADIRSALNTLFGGSGDAGGDAGKQAETEQLEAAGQAEEAENEMDQDFENEYNASKDGTVYGESSTPGKRDVDAKLTAGLLWNRVADSKDDDPRGDAHVGVRTPDPDGGEYDSGYVEKYKAPPKDSGLVEALKDAALPEREAPLDPVESMSQPVDDEAQDRERPVHLEESLDSSLDANINWGDDSSGGLSSPDKKVNLEPDNKLVDPPDFTSGEGESGGKNPPK